MGSMIKIIIMKTSGNQTNKQNKQQQSQKQRPEIRDNLDSRKNEEQDFKGQDVTHNEKNVQSEGKSKNKDRH